MPAGTDYELGVSAASGFEGLWRHNQGVSFPYDFGSLATTNINQVHRNLVNYYYYLL